MLADKVYHEAYNKYILTIVTHLYFLFQEKISKLFDNGQKLQGRIAYLREELETIRMKKDNKNEIIDLDDDISEQLDRAVNV